MQSTISSTQAGTLDPTFANEGVMKWPIEEINRNSLAAVLALPDDKLIVVAVTSTRPSTGFTVARLTKTGTLDARTGFGDGQRGFIEFLLPNLSISPIQGIRRLNDEGMLITAYYYGADAGLLVVRLLKDGSLNESFGQGGVLLINNITVGGAGQTKTIPITPARSHDNRHAASGARFAANTGVSGIEQVDGKIVLVSTVTDTSDGKNKGMITRLESDGSFDKTFNESGSALVELENFDEGYGVAVAAQQDGKLVVAGDFFTAGREAFYAVRFTQDGKQDTQFSTLIMHSDESHSVRDIAVRERDGMIVLVGGQHLDNYNAKSIIVVLNRNGGFNQVFNQGKPLYSKLLPERGEMWKRCAFGGDNHNKLIVAGTTTNDFLHEPTAAIAARYSFTGELDLSFNDKGWMVFDQPEHIEVTRDMKVMPDGRIIMCGDFFEHRLNPSAYAGWLIRLLA